MFPSDAWHVIRMNGGGSSGKITEVAGDSADNSLLIAPRLFCISCRPHGRLVATATLLL